jgi:hypothetical protein
LHVETQSHLRRGSLSTRSEKRGKKGSQLEVCAHALALVHDNADSSGLLEGSYDDLLNHYRSRIAPFRIGIVVEFVLGEGEGDAGGVEGWNRFRRIHGK